MLRTDLYPAYQWFQQTIKKNIHPHTRDDFPIPLTLCDRQQQQLIQWFRQKLVPLSRVCLPSALRLMLQTSRQICLGYDEWNSAPCLWGVLFWALSDNIHQFHPGKHYFILDLGRHNWLTRKGHCTLPENDSEVLRVSCHYLTKFHNRESTGDCRQINDLPGKIQFSDSHCAPFCSQFFFFCHLSKTINLADSLVSGHQDSHSIITLGFWSLLMFMMLFWAVVFHSYFCHSFHILMNHF